MRQSGFAAIFAGLFLFVGVSACGGDECGDSICGESEDRESCPKDCAVCGDGFCDAEGDETIQSCPEDCYDPCTAEAVGTGESCMSHTECGDGGYCERFEGDAGPRCYQVCVSQGCPDGDLCGEGERCVQIVDGDGEEVPHRGYPLGLCFEVPVGDQGAYQACGGGDGNCQTGMDCVTVNATHGAFCSPVCGGGVTCPAASNDMAGSCVLISEGDTPDHCALSGCTEANPCPTGMECVDLGGVHLCLWP